MPALRGRNYQLFGEIVSIPARLHVGSGSAADVLAARFLQWLVVGDMAQRGRGRMEHAVVPRRVLPDPAGSALAPASRAAKGVDHPYMVLCSKPGPVWF